MMPLWTTAISPRETMGCAFSVSGAPCVAQRVCARPVAPRVFFALDARSFTRETVLTRSIVPLSTSASPQES